MNTKAETRPNSQAQQARGNQQVATQNKGGRQVANRAWSQDDFSMALDRAMPMLQPMLPTHVAPQKFRSMILTEVAYNEKLWDCPIKSIIQSVRDAADLGLSLNKTMKEGDIIPVWSPKGTNAQFRPRAIGLAKLAVQGGLVIDIWAHVVYENDEFWYKQGLNKDLVHNPAKEGLRGEMTQQAFCCWKLADGTVGFEVIGTKRIARAKAASEGFKAFEAGRIKTTPWVTDEEEMIRKTAIIAASKFMPKSTESDKFARAVAMTDVNFDDVVEHDPNVPVPPRPTRKDTKAAAEKLRAEQEEQESQYHERMGPGGAGGASQTAHDPKTGEVIENDDDADQHSEPDSGNSQGTATTSEKTQQPARGQAAPSDEKENARRIDMAEALIKKINGAGTLRTFNAIVQESQELEDLRTEAPNLYSNVMAAVETKKKWFAR